MDYLLDTHTLVWYLSNNPKLTKEAKDIILNSDNTIYYSTINLWEILIKSKKEKLLKYDNMNELNVDIIETGLLPLPFFPHHIYALEQITKNSKKIKHKDPFDRALLSQAKENKMYLLTHDVLLKEYKEKYIKFY